MGGKWKRTEQKWSTSNSMKNHQTLMAKLKKQESFEMRRLKKYFDSKTITFICVSLMISSHDTSYKIVLLVIEFHITISTLLSNVLFPMLHSFVVSFFPSIQFIEYQTRQDDGKERQEQDKQQRQQQQQKQTKQKDENKDKRQR